MNKVSKVDLEYFERRFRSEPYIIINRLYTEEVLDKVKGNLKISEGLWQTVQMVGKLVDLGDFSYNERLELIFYAVMTNDEADILFLKSNPQLCDKCGWWEHSYHSQLEGEPEYGRNLLFNENQTFPLFVDSYIPLKFIKA